MKMSFTCTKPASSVHRRGAIYLCEPEAYTLKMSITSRIKGKGEKMDMDSSGKWLATDCGGVKPIVIPKMDAKK